MQQQQQQGMGIDELRVGHTEQSIKYSSIQLGGYVGWRCNRHARPMNARESRAKYYTSSSSTPTTYASFGDRGLLAGSRETRH